MLRTNKRGKDAKVCFVELENLLVKAKSKNVVAEESPITKVEPKEVHQTDFARSHVPNVFEHQYAEYISGLKPPYSGLGFPSKRAAQDLHKEEKDQEIHGD